MRQYKTSLGETIDLDDPKNYDYLPNNVEELRKIMLSEIGYTYCYMKHWRPEMFKSNDQKKRVKKMIKYFSENEKDNANNIMWYKEQIYLFQEEIENMC